MLLEDLGINPASFSEASHVIKIMLGKCALFVPCNSDEEAQHIKATVTTFFGSPVITGDSVA